MSWDYRLSRQAEKAYARMEPGVRRRIAVRLDEFCLDPYDPRTSKELANRRRDASGPRWRLPNHLPR